MSPKPQTLHAVPATPAVSPALAADAAPGHVAPTGRPEWDTRAWSLHLLELRLLTWWARHGVTLLRLALGLVFFWFGVLKFFPGASSAEALAGNTISVLSFHLIPPQVSLPVLAVWECAIGLGLLTGRFLKLVLLLLFAQMAGTFLPLVFFPHETFVHVPLVPTLEGQYIIKNLVLISAALVIGAVSRGGSIIFDPAAARVAEHSQLVHFRFRRRFHRDP